MPQASEKYLVTGAAGFICSHLIQQLLDEGHEVLGIDNFDPFYAKQDKDRNLGLFCDHPNFTFIEGDISKPSTFEDLGFKADFVIHFAAKAGVLPSLKDPEGYINSNIMGTSCLLQWMVQNEIKNYVFASSSSVYGNNEKTPFSETDDVSSPISPYAFTKRSCELMNHTFHKLYGINTMNLRLFTVYGPRQRPDLAIHKFSSLIKEGKPIEKYGDGTTARDYTYVEDTVRGVLAACNYLRENNEVFEIVNLGNNKPVALNTLIDLLYSLSGKEANVLEKPMQAGDVKITFADISKAKRLLGYEPKVGIEEGLKRFLNWHEQQ